jgi:hypothetical protein
MFDDRKAALAADFQDGQTLRFVFQDGLQVTG